NVEFGPDLLFAFESGLADFEKRGVIERFVQAVVLRNLAIAADFRTDRRLIKNLAEIEASRFPMFDGFARFEAIGSPDHFVDRAETELRHELADFLGDEAHEIDNMSG